jgi:hypothetical protein
MTEQQVKEQLDRLSIFGNIQTIEQFKEYFKALQYMGYTELYSAVDWLVLNHDKRGLPFPAEIIRVSRELVAKKNEAAEAAQRESKYTGSLKATQEFCAVFRLIWLIEDVSIRRDFWERKLSVPLNMNDNDQIEFYRKVRKEAESYLSAKGIQFLTTHSFDLVPKMSDTMQSDEYGF